MNFWENLWKKNFFLMKKYKNWYKLINRYFWRKPFFWEGSSSTPSCGKTAPENHFQGKFNSHTVSKTCVIHRRKCLQLIWILCSVWCTDFSLSSFSILCADDYIVNRNWVHGKVFIVICMIGVILVFSAKQSVPMSWDSNLKLELSGQTKKNFNFNCTKCLFFSFAWLSPTYICIIFRCVLYRTMRNLVFV